MKKKILLVSGLVVAGIGAALLILRSSKKNKKDESKRIPEIELWDFDRFDIDPEEELDAGAGK